MGAAFVRRFLLVTCAAAVATLFAASYPARAEGGQAFTISPPLIELDANPGQTVQAVIKLTNVSDGDLSIAAQTNDFGSKNETGEPNIIFDDKEPTPYTLKGWVTTPDAFTLASKETKTINVPIAVPLTAEPGGHYGVVRFTGSSTANGDNDVALSASIGSLVLLRVSGDVKQDAQVEEFYSATTDFSKQSFFESGPVTMVTRIRNSGNIHVKPTGTVTIKDMYGNVVETVRLNGDPESDNEPRSILPQSVRRLDAKLASEQFFGKYTATMQLTYGDGKMLSSETSFWVLPVKLIVLGIVGIAVGITLLVLGIKRYNAHIIKKATNKDDVSR